MATVYKIELTSHWLNYHPEDIEKIIEKAMYSEDMNEVTAICAKAEPLIIEINKDHLVELYNFAYEQAVKTGKVDELKEIDGKINGC